MMKLKITARELNNGYIVCWKTARYNYQIFTEGNAADDARKFYDHKKKLKTTSSISLCVILDSTDQKHLNLKPVVA